jgi:RNA polymerase sigma factor (TIGR02999 family)
LTEERSLPQGDGSVVPLPSNGSSDSRRPIDGAIVRLYEELHDLASRHLRRERSSHTLQPTALANEAYVRLTEQRSIDWSDAAEFLTAASVAIRRILIDHARSKSAAKRGGDWTRIDLGDVPGGEDTGVDLLDLDQALDELSDMSDRQARLVELRFFGGLSRDEAADVLAISPRTADNEWRVARTWLRGRLSSVG